MQPTWFTIALVMKTYILVAVAAVFGLLGLFTSGCSDDTLSCSEVDASAADGASGGGADLATGSDALANVPDAPVLTDAADASAAGEDGGGAVADAGGNGGLDLGSVAGDGPGVDSSLDLGGVASDGAGGLDIGGSAGPDAQVGIEAGG